MEDEDGTEVWYLPDPLGWGEVLFRVHPRSRCSGACAMHGPSDHWASEMPIEFNAIARQLNRVCGHGQEHPDPDAWAWRLDTGVPAPSHTCGCEPACRGYLPPF